ncbi:uncharacterized protein ACHE_80379A [Aspergillus chevalieri]|uniref:Cytochrome P450 n=1 Tax=Aspergillus chevalieri TaxID=182096 RepID=A0A7R7ZTA5_ASPCH|nr:uncharacterized protein ACHE_80379A [Aspergillus chevalieri]BCR92479.1 hypothetical protein ACHE_80379A [Aspergillus chevalieri]
MTAHWVDQYSSTSDTSSNLIIPGLQDDITKLTLNIFCGAGFGVHLPFKPSLKSTTENANAHDQFRDSATPSPGYDFTFRSVAEYIGPNLTSIFLTVGILPKWLSFILRPFFKTPLKAYHNLGKYLRALITMSQEEESNAHNLLAGLVRARREEQQKESGNEDTKSKYGAGLSDQEILGNLFMFTIAGHETSSTSLRFAFVLLAMHQDIQDWLYEGIKEAVADEPEDLAKWDYVRVFPKLIAPLCVMLETLRLYPPVVTLPKWTSHSPAPITLASTTYTLPPGVPISLNANALHYSPEYWGPDVTIFKPSRWDKRNTTSFLAKNDGIEGLNVAGLDFDTVHKPVRGAFIPFSDGSRACMGKKFAEVEFVAALSVVFWQYRVRLVGEERGAKERAEKALGESSAFLTLGMRDDVPLRFERR